MLNFFFKEEIRLQKRKKLDPLITIANYYLKVNNLI